MCKFDLVPINYNILSVIEPQDRSHNIGSYPAKFNTVFSAHNRSLAFIAYLNSGIDSNFYSSFKFSTRIKIPHARDGIISFEPAFTYYVIYIERIGIIIDCTYIAVVYRDFRKDSFRHNRSNGFPVCTNFVKNMGIAYLYIWPSNRRPSRLETSCLRQSSWLEYQTVKYHKRDYGPIQIPP